MTQKLSDNSLSTAEEKLNISAEEEVFVFPASFAQQRLWLLDRLFPGNTFYNVATALRLTGSLDIAALEQTFNEIVHRHEALRTTFRMLEEQPVQVIASALTLPLTLVDLQYLPPTEQEVEIRRLAIQERSRPFNLSQDPLLRVTLLQLDSSEHVLLLNLHHIVSDGWSIGVLIRELGTLYTAFTNNQPSPLPELPIQYADFTHWQREWLQEGGETHESPLQIQLAYWKQQLDNLPRLNLPTDRTRLGTPTYQGAMQFLELPKSLGEKLEALSQHQGVTLFMTLLAAFQTLLYRYTQQTDIVVGSPIANRNRREIEGLIGFFVNSLVLRTNLSGNPTFLQLLDRVREVALGAYAHQDLPFEKLVEELHPERNLSHHPLFQVAFSLQNTPIEALELPGLTLSPLEFDIPSAKFDLEFHMWESPEGLRGQVVYSTDLFDDATITRMLGHYQTLLEAIVTHPEQRICELPLLTAAEWQQLLIDRNDTRKERGGECFHQLFEAQVEQTPEAIAIVFEDQKLSYRELNIRANQLAHHLQQLGVTSDVLVGIFMERSIEMIVGLLGILKAGGAYLPLDPTYPQERLNFMLEDAQVSILLTHSLLAPFFKGSWEDRAKCSQQHDLTLIDLDKDWKTIALTSQQNPTSRVTPDNLAYVIYTSGSTGKPKGVLIEHRGLSNLAQAQIEAFNLQPSNRVLQFASLSFDASIFEIVMALRTGATLYLAKKESLVPGQALLKFLREKAITHVTLPPAVLAVLPTAELPALKIIIAAGESCSPDIVKRWAAGRWFFNAYGPTETTVWATVAEISSDSEKLVIGRAIANTQVYILDLLQKSEDDSPTCSEQKDHPARACFQTSPPDSDPPQPPLKKGENSVKVPLFKGDLGGSPGLKTRPSSPYQGGNKSERSLFDAFLQPVPIGITGELYIGGDGLARGYLNRPELTAERFIPNPFSNKEGARLYKTGDLARYQPDGNIEFLGRIDEQVKIRGFRIELGEIEAVLSQHPFVREVVVIAREDVAGDRRLVAYVVPNPELASTVGTQSLAPLLRQFLKEKLPEYMMPSAFVELESLPLTHNGKVNRKALPTPNAISQPTETGFIAPRTPTELTLAKIWAEILNVERVGIRDNFFDLGGDSLLAVRLVDRIHKQFERELPLSVLFLNPTVEGLANTLSSQTDSLPWSPLVAIQPAGSKPPFFCIHPILGVVFPYYELAYHLGSDQPFYALQSLGIDGKHPPLTRIEEMATYYIKALRTVQPEGPYFLGGWSFGGLVAFEMAQQLQREGHEVALLAILDTLAPVAANKPSLWEGYKFLFTTVRRSIWPFLVDYFYLLTTSNQQQGNVTQEDQFGDRITPHSTNLNQILRRLVSKLSWHSVIEQAAIANLMSQESKPQILRELTIRPMFPVFQANSQATLSYAPQPYPKRITLFRTSIEVTKNPDNPTLGWNELTSEGVDVHLVPGNHLTMLKIPNVQVLAKQLKRCIEKTKH